MAGDERISVSRDKLRADLSELELRLRIYFDEQLKHKADLHTVIEHGVALDALARGEFTDSQRRAIRACAEEVIVHRTDEGWTARQRTFGVIAVVVAILSLVFTLYFGLRTASGAEADERVTIGVVHVDR